MTERCEIAVIGSGFAGSIMARVLTRLRRDVVLLERGSHPRFALGESSTPLANLSLERLARRYDMPDCHRLATHGRWLEHHPDVRRGLKRGFTFYRHHPGEKLQPNERLLVAASPDDRIADTHWLRADVDHHFVRAAIAAGVDYRDHVELTAAHFDSSGVTLSGERKGSPIDLRADFVIDASGPGGFLARQLEIPSALDRTLTRSSVLFSHFTGVRPIRDVVSGLQDGPYPDDWAAVHHIVDEGWMYALRFDHGIVSAGFTLRPTAADDAARSLEARWQALLAKYPTIGALFANAQPTFPISYRQTIQHRLTHAAGDRWVLLPHAFAFIDPLFSTGIAWSLRAIERLALLFESDLPRARELSRYDTLLAAEANQIDRMVAGAYDAMAHFDLFAAHAMLYFASVSFSEVRQRLLAHDVDSAAWTGFLGVGDEVLAELPHESLTRLRPITRGRGEVGSPDERAAYVDWMRSAIAPRNIGGFGDRERRNLYPVDLDLLIESHAALGMTRDELVAALPALRGMRPGEAP